MLKLKKYRKMKQLSQIELAKRANMTQQYISILENDHTGERLPSFQVIESLGLALQINPKDLIEYEYD